MKVKALFQCLSSRSRNADRILPSEMVLLRSHLTSPVPSQTLYSLDQSHIKGIYMALVWTIPHLMVSPLLCDPVAHRPGVDQEDPAGTMCVL